MIDHADVREQLELAAVEPGGLDRLAAGDTPQAAAIAGHLAGCPTCAEEARRLAELAPVVREVAVTVPPDDLRERTLALVRSVGRQRGTSASIAMVPATAAASAPTQLAAADEPSAVVPAAAPVPIATPSAATRRASRWPVALAAAIAVVLISGGALFVVRLAQDLRDQTEALAELNAATLDVTSAADAARVDLAAPAGSGGAATGTLVFSPTSTEIVISAPELARPATGEEYACWVSRPDGTRARIGRDGVRGRARLLDRLVGRAPRGGARDDVRGDPRRCGGPAGRARRRPRRHGRVGLTRRRWAPGRSPDRVVAARRGRIRPACSTRNDARSGHSAPQARQAMPGRPSVRTSVGMPSVSLATWYEVSSTSGASTRARRCSPQRGQASSDRSAFDISTTSL